MADDYKKEAAIFDAAILIEDPQARDAYLAKACGDDHKLRGNIDKLLKAHFEGSSLLDKSMPGARVTLDMDPIESTGTVIGRYKLLQQIGEGGFGVVYMAEQEKPIRRRVALKIIKLGMDTKQVVARFEAERQALAMMDHPNIAKVFDAGATDTGRPYFVMELVKGIPVTEYCDKNNFDMQQRLELFIDICKAVQHAHQKGIIHRDIKPSNVMVTLHDGKPVPKVIDFGIAKATQQRLTEKTLFTEFKQFIGTPEYMSPEQAEMSGLDVDTRTDIYSLGVLLYELLTGTTPFGDKELRSIAFDEIRRIIREEEPPKPSTCLSTLGDSLDDVAKHRKSVPNQLCKVVRGELDWIVMMSLEKDRTRRYETANDLALDIQRHLSDEPVIAGPPSAAYRMQKFVRRNRTAVMVGLVVLAALVIGLSLATVGFIQASQQRNRALVAETEAVTQRDKAMTAEAEAVTQRDVAEQAREKEATAKIEAEKARDKAEKQLYFNRTALAYTAIKMDDLRYARELLDSSPEVLRGWEWYMLYCIIDRSLFAVSGDTGSIISVCFSPDGKRIASASQAFTIIIWNGDGSTLERTLYGHTGLVRSIAFSPDGRRIVSGGFDNTLRIWDANSGNLEQTLNGHEGAVYSVAFSPDGKRIVSGGV